MRYRTILFLLSILLCTGACTKKSSTPPSTPPTTTTTTSPYYFKFTLGAGSYDLNADIPQYITFYPNVAGGYQVANGNLFPSVGLSFTWPMADTVKESDILGLAGKTLHFSDTTIQPQLTMDTTASASTWTSVDTSNTSYSVSITAVTFLKNDTTLGTPVRTYVITGTCSGVMSQLSGATTILSSGQFNFIISRQNW